MGRRRLTNDKVAAVHIQLITGLSEIFLEVYQSCKLPQDVVQLVTLHMRKLASHQEELRL